MNKSIILILCLLMVLSCVSGLTSCNDDHDHDACSHQWGEWSTTKTATCTTTGTKERTCSDCGEKETSTISALGHDWTEANCSTPKTCKTCSATEGSASAHAYIVETVKDEALKSAATCTSAAVYYKSCSCGAISTSDEDTFTSGDPKAHSFTVETVKDDALKTAATCTSAAVYYKSCSCGAVSTNDTDTFTSGDPAAHSFTLETVKDEALKSAATTESAAVYYKSCSCGAISTNDADTFTYGAPLGHTHSFTVETVKNEAQKTPASCDSAAVYYKSCSCGAISTNDAETFTSGSALGHKDEGKDHICDNGCGKNDMGACTDSDTDNDHVCDYGCGKALNACADAAGDNNHSCDVCGKENVSDHDYGAATCGTPATCSECGATTGDTAVHIYNQTVVKPEALKSSASCTSAAVYYKSCSCGAVSTNDAATFTNGDPLSHKDENLDHICDHGCGKNDMGAHTDSVGDNDHVCDYGCGVKISDCSDASNDGNHSCDECGNADVSAHSYGNATCGAPATCSECGATTGATLEHTDNNHDHICDNGCGKNDMGTCADSTTDADHVCDYGNGYATGCKAVLNDCSDINTDADHACDVCGKANVTAHSYVEDAELATEATCNAAATKTYKCNCGDEYTETVGAALGHDITGVTPIERPVEGSDCEYVLVYICQNSNCENENKEVIGETVYHHNYVASISREATCETPGEKTFKCSVCGDTSKAPEEIPANATGHSWVEGAVSDGVRTDRCSICEMEKTVMVSNSNSASSNASDLADADVQLKVDDNTNANIQLGQGVADAIGDKDITISAVVVDKNTLEGMGVSEEQLGQIGANTVYDFNIKDGNGTSISDFGENNFVTITLPYTLSDGEDIDSIAVWFISDTCQVEGCDKGADCVEAHKLVSIEATYSNGFVTFQTNHFSIYTVTRLTPAQRCALYGHGYVCQHVEGSCTKDSYDLYVCVRCHDRYIDKDSHVVADGHDYAIDTHAATCTEDGYVDYSCKDCDYSYRTKLVAIGHVWSVEDSDEASCTADGYAKYGCDNCDEEYTVTYAKLAHVYTDTLVPATCSADGYTLHDCDNCEYSYTDAYVDALGHAYEPTTWAWAADYSSATLTFVCENDEEHTIVVNASITTSVVNGTCSNFVRTTYTASVSYNDTSYTDEQIVETGTPDHVFSSEWKSDEDEHWHECVCGAKTDVTEHSFENANVTKDVEDINIRCEMGDEVESEIVNTDGEVIGYRYECTCTKCGLVFAEEEWIEQHSACKYTEYEVMYIYKDGVTLFQCVNDWYSEEHKYEYSVGDDFVSCEERHTVIAHCTVCDETEEWTTSGHRYEYRETNLSELGLCGGQIWEEYCPICNEILYANVNDWCEWEYIEQTEDGHNKYQCRNCGAAKIEYIHESEKDENCMYERTEIRSYIVNGEEVYGYERTYKSESHNYQYEYTLNGGTCEDGYFVTRYCSDCEHSKSYESYGHHHASRELDLGEYGLCGGTIYEEYCSICKTVLQSGFNEKCSWDYVEETEDGYDKFECRRCGAVKLQYSFAGEKDENCCYDYTVVCSFIVDGEEVYRFETTYTREEHKYKYSYEMNGDSCTDGVVMTTTCEDCSIHWTDTYYDHNVQLAERIDLGEHGACYGEYERYSCACGEEGWVNLDCCADVWTNNEYFDDELGKMVYVEARTCEYCGLRYERSYYEVEDPDNCRITDYYTVVISIDNELVAETQYTSVGSYHSGYTTYELIGGVGSSCEDGVIVTFRCERCTHEDIYETYWHELFVKESFDLSAMGSVCGGHATHYGCACGERNEMSLEHDLCERGEESCLLWIEDAITEGQYTINGYNSIWNESYIYICSVTDPADKACGFKIRYAYYWMKDENSCVAYRYETWQFGYDEETGTCQREVTFRTGGSMIYHNYEDNSVTNHVRLDCIDCDSYYEEKYIYDGENQVGYEKRISNTLDNGYDKYYEYIEEYAYDESDGSWYTAREYRKYIDEDGSESWSENTIEKYEGTFGEDGRKVVKSACDRNGYLYEEEYAYVWYKGYEYTIYYVRTEGDYWYRYDYTYDLIDGCVRTTVYTDSNGETWTDEEDWCFFHKGHTVKEPTCSQSGIGYDICVICDIHTDNYDIEPHDHDWIEVREGWYCCYRCGLENANGVSGDIIMEDLTEKYGNGENYVVGYYGRNDVDFTMFVALVWDDGREEIVEGLEFWTIDGIRAYAVSKAAVEAWANERGYEGYKVKFSFVPVGSDSSFDYGVTFTETMHVDTITDDISFVDYVPEGEWVSYTITPVETGTWTFTSDSYFDTYAELCDAEGNCIEYDDDGGEEANFMITYELVAGKTYTIRVKWLSDNRAGNMALVFAN